MAYTLSIPADLRTTGLTLLCSFFNTSGTLHATLRNLACTELGTSGFYRFSSASIDDGYRGQAVFHTGTITGAADLNASNFKGGVSINPQEVENSDATTSSVATTLALVPKSGQTNTWTNTGTLEAATVAIT